MTIPNAGSCTRLLAPSFSLHLLIVISWPRVRVIFAPFFSNGPAQWGLTKALARPAAQAVQCHRPISKSWWGSRQATRTTVGAAGSAAAGAAASKVRDGGERAPLGGSAEAGAATTWVLDDGERLPPGGSAEAGATATRVL